MEYKEFAEAFCRWVPVAKGVERLSLKEKSNFDCIFWGAGGCTVYESRPFQCKAFPFWSSTLNSPESWEAIAAGCPGIGQGPVVSSDSIEKWLAERRNEPIIVRSI